MGVIVGCNHMGWGILGERLQLVTSILTGFRPHVVTDSAVVFAGFGYSPWYAAYSPPQYPRNVVCAELWCISTTVGAIPGPGSRSSRLVLYAENAFDFRVEACHRVRARTHTRSSSFTRMPPLDATTWGTLEGLFRPKRDLSKRPRRAFRGAG